MEKFRAIKIEYAKNIINDSDAIKYIKNTNDQTLEFRKDRNIIIKNEPLLDVEIAIQRCKRAGMFQGK